MKKNNFNFLRFYFAFIVIIGHLIEISGVTVFQPFAPFFSTYISVTAFFCISGFLITMSYQTTPTLKAYFTKRAARLLPAYIFAILACTIFLSLASNYSLVEYFTHPQLFKYLAANLSFLNFVEPCLPGVFTSGNTFCAVNGALWTLKVEVSFYLAIPILLYFVNKIKRKYILMIIIYVLSVVYRLAFDKLGELTESGIYTMLSRQLPGFLSYFICGIALYYYFDIFIQHKLKLLILGIILFATERIIGIEILSPLGLSLIVFSVAFSFEKLNSFAKHGDISYGIYIFHFPVLQVIKSLGFFEKYNPYLVSIIFILTVLLIGYASWHLLEKKFLAKSKSIRIDLK